MSLTERDVGNTKKLKELLNSRSNASTVSAALSISTTLVSMLRDGGKLYMRDREGVKNVVIPGLHL